jgi:hypothetical protein
LRSRLYEQELKTSWRCYKTYPSKFWWPF